MKKGLGIILLLSVVLIGTTFLGKITGAVGYPGYPSGRYFQPKHLEREITDVEIIGTGIGKDGLPWIRKGEVIIYTIKPGKYGVFTGAKLKNAVNGLRIDGAHGAKAGDADFCSLSYVCRDEIQQRCSITGPKCYGDKEGKFRTANLKPGKYAITVCDARKDLNNCLEVGAKFNVVKSEFKKIRTKTFYRGQSMML